MRAVKVVLLHLVVAVGCVAFTVVICGVVGIGLDMMREKNVVPISEMLTESANGRLDEVKIHGTRYEYRVRGTAQPRVAYGPKTTETEAKIIGAPHIIVE